MSKERLEDIKNRYMELEYDFNLRKEDIEWLIERIDELEEILLQTNYDAALLEKRTEELLKLNEQNKRYREAIRKTKYAIHTQISSINHQENTELERKYLAGIMFASRMMDRYFNKALESDNE